MQYNYMGSCIDIKLKHIITRAIKGFIVTTACP